MYLTLSLRMLYFMLVCASYYYYWPLFFNRGGISSTQWQQKGFTYIHSWYSDVEFFSLGVRTLPQGFSLSEFQVHGSIDGISPTRKHKRSWLRSRNSPSEAQLWSWDFSHSEDKTYRYNRWDFSHSGEQQTYQTIHEPSQIFQTQRQALRGDPINSKLNRW